MGGVACSEACCQEAQLDKGMEDRVASMVQLEAGDSLVSPEPRKEDLRPMTFNKAPAEATPTPVAAAPTTTTAHAVPTMVETVPAISAVETIPEGDGKHVHLETEPIAGTPATAMEDPPAAAAEEAKEEAPAAQEEPAPAPEKQEAPPVIAPKKQTIQRKHTGFVNDEKAQEIQAKKGCCSIS